MKCEAPCRGELRISHTYARDDQKFQRAYCTTCKRVYCLETLRAPAEDRGTGAAARAKRAVTALLLLLALCLPSGCALLRPATPIRIQECAESFDARLFTGVVTALVREAPLDAAVKITVCQIDGPFLGMTWPDSATGGFRILIEARQSMSGILDTLVHEWAHCMVWSACREGSHDAMWGVAMARAYRISLAFRMPNPFEQLPPSEIQPPPTGPSTN